MKSIKQKAEDAAKEAKRRLEESSVAKKASELGGTARRRASSAASTAKGHIAPKLEKFKDTIETSLLDAADKFGPRRTRGNSVVGPRKESVAHEDEADRLMTQQFGSLGVKVTETVRRGSRKFLTQVQKDANDDEVLVFTNSENNNKYKVTDQTILFKGDTEPQEVLFFVNIANIKDKYIVDQYGTKRSISEVAEIVKAIDVQTTESGKTHSSRSDMPPPVPPPHRFSAEFEVTTDDEEMPPPPPPPHISGSYEAVNPDLPPKLPPRPTNLPSSKRKSGSNKKG
jgi:hypothetical protein